MLARSKAGHDKGKVYYVLGKDEDYSYLSDGSSHLLDKPKRKRHKHIQPIHKYPDEINILLEEKEILRDEDIRKILKIYYRHEIRRFECRKQMS